MFIEIKELEQHPIDFQEQFPPKTIDLGPDVTQSGPLKTSGRAQLVEEHHGKHVTIQDIRLAGELDTTVETLCARCLSPVSVAVSKQFDLLYRPHGSDAGREELSVTAAEAEVGYYQGTGIQLEDALREQLLLAVPLKALCRQDCKGLCQHCGVNLNDQSCSCAEPGDERWSGLKDIRNKMQQ